MAKKSLHVFPAGQYRHTHLGLVTIDAWCVALQECNPDTTSVFITDASGETKEVSKAAVTPEPLTEGL